MIPVDFHPTRRTVNVIPVASLSSAIRFAKVAAQTVGIYPPARKVELRDRIARVGVQRLVSLGQASLRRLELSHDGAYPTASFGLYSSSRNSSAEKSAWRRIDRRVPMANSRCMGHDHGAAVGVTELHVAPALAHVFEACLSQCLDDFAPRDSRKRRSHAESSTVAMTGGSTPSGSGMSS